MTSPSKESLAETKPVREIFNVANISQPDVSDQLLKKWRLWKTLRICAWISRFIRNVGKRNDSRKGPLSIAEIQERETWWINRVQARNQDSPKFEEDRARLNLRPTGGILKCHVSRNLLRFKSRWLLAHDPRHFTIGTVFFVIFIKYKYLHLFSARRFQCLILFRSTQHTCVSSIHSLLCDSRAPQCELNQHTQLYPYHLTHIHFLPLFIVSEQEYIFYYPQVPLRNWNMFTDIFVPILWFIISPQSTTPSQVMSVTSLCGIGCYHYKAKFMSHHVFMHATI